jgi:thiol-disulfide isomerase/thioredoxin
MHMPSLGAATEWLNSEPLGPAELRGHVVLVNFWTWTCINWLRQEPHVRAWSQAYRDEGLIVIGVHTPEFSFEHDIEGVRRAIEERAIDYPVVVDNDYAIWNAFANRYWPALYFVDADGIIREQHFGEGRYETSERVIQQLLGIDRELVTVEGVGVEAEADWDHLRTPETYLGYWSSRHFASPGGGAYDERRAYGLPKRLGINHWASPVTGRSVPRRSCSTRRAGASASGSTRATRILCCLPERESRSPSACSSTARLPARLTAWTSTRTATVCSRTAACTSSCASTTPSATER